MVGPQAELSLATPLNILAEINAVVIEICMDESLHITLYQCPSVVFQSRYYECRQWLWLYLKCWYE